MKILATSVALMMTVSLSHAMDGRSYSYVVSAAFNKDLNMLNVPVVVLWAPQHQNVESPLSRLREQKCNLLAQAQAIRRDMDASQQMLDLEPGSQAIQTSIDALEEKLNEITEELENIEASIEELEQD